MKTQKGVEIWLHSFISALDGGERLTPGPDALPSEMTRYPFYMRVGGRQGWSGRMRKISPTPEFGIQTVQPVASRYTVLRYRGPQYLPDKR
jgi:hypothetical protein